MEKTSNAIPVKIVPIGNSKGIRIPKRILQKYGFKNDLVLISTENGLLMRDQKKDKLSWEQTYREMAKETEDWSDFEILAADGLD